MELGKIRADIDHLDDQIAALLAARLPLVRAAADAKRAAGRPVYDPAREIALADRFPAGPVREAMRGIVVACRGYAEDAGDADAR